MYIIIGLSYFPPTDTILLNENKNFVLKKRRKFRRKWKYRWIISKKKKLEKKKKERILRKIVTSSNNDPTFAVISKNFILFFSLSKIDEFYAVIFTALVIENW